VGDFSTIELRVNLALAGQEDKIELLASGADPYIDMAQLIYKRALNKKDNPAERQTGKNSVLGLGFQMGAPKFQLKYAPDMPLEIDPENPEIMSCQGVVQTFRKEWAPKVPSNWYDLEAAAVRTVHDRTPHEAHGVEYRIEEGWLTARLPSGRKLWYFNPQPTRKAMPWDATDIRLAWTYQAMKLGRFQTIDAYGGLLTENVVQALARDLMVAAMFLCEKNGLPVVLTVHDEIVTEPLRADADPKALEQIMCERPDWAKSMNIPVAAECWAGERYKK
jgi:DNA polymerase